MIDGKFLRPPEGVQMQQEVPLVEMQGISKVFGAVQALQDVNLKLHHKEVLGLVGDNSAGKSTLMKILSGAYIPDSGQILFEGGQAPIHSPQGSRALGIEMIYQDFALCTNMDISSNIFLARWPGTRYGLEVPQGRASLPRRLWRSLSDSFVNVRQMDQVAEDVLQGLGVLEEVHSVKLRVDGLSGGRQQMVAIARAVSFNPKVVIMDEPTANLSPAATGRVHDVMRDLKNHGVAIIIISHSLVDIFEVADRVMVLKRGRNVGERVVKETTEDDVLSIIVQGDAYERSQTV